VADEQLTRPDPSKWTIHEERTVDDSRKLKFSIAKVELPDGVVFEQYVLRMPKAAMTVVLDDARENVLMIWRHRFIPDQYTWELPGGYVDPDEEDPAAAAAAIRAGGIDGRPTALENRSAYCSSGNNRPRYPARNANMLPSATRCPTTSPASHTSRSSPPHPAPEHHPKPNSRTRAAKPPALLGFSAPS
jgi:hypothetical protein